MEIKMKLQKLFFSFLLISHPLIGMQPAQWLRNITPHVQAQLKAEDATQATKELIMLSRRLTAENRAEQLEKVKKLLARGANPNAVSTHPLMSGLSESVLYQAIPDYPEIVEALLKAGANPSTTVNALNRPLIFAVIEAYHHENNTSKSNLITIFKMLLDYGANPNTRNDWEGTPLFTAMSASPEMVHLLLCAGANPNVFNITRRSPLIEAIEESNIATISLLLQAGANPLARAPNSAFNLNALDIVHEKLWETQYDENQDQHKKYTKILNMLEHPETIRRIGLQKLQ